MNSPSQNAAFLRDKQLFFSTVRVNGNADSKIETVDKRAKTVGYSFLITNHKSLETEFIEMFTILQKHDNDKKEVFWLYCYYCASLLEAFYKAYSQADKEERYKAIKKQIKSRLNHDAKVVESEEHFIDYLKDSFLKGFRNLVGIPYHISQIRDNVAFINLCRLYWAFCRLTLTTGLNVAKDLHLIDKLDAILGTHTDVDKIISVFQAPIPVINYLSVGFFAFRIMIDGGLLLRHTFFPTELEKGAETGSEVYKMEYLPGVASIEAYRNQYIMVQTDSDAEFDLYYIPKAGEAKKLPANNKSKLKTDLLSNLAGQPSRRLSAKEVKDLITANTGHSPEPTTAFDRFKFELYKRQCNFANDFVWATVNFLTNLNHLSHIPGPVTGYITAGFLIFDVAMVLYKCHLAKQEYLSKSAQYIQERDDYLNNPQKFKLMPDATRLLHVDMLTKQLQELEINWRMKESTFYFVASAAALLMMGFTAAIIITNPVLILGSFFVCTIAVAMYLSSDSYAKYREKSLYLQGAELSGHNLPAALKEFEAARNDFIFTMVKNTVMPMIMISTFAICWPAAVVLTAMYVGYEIYHAYDQHADGKAAKQLALAPPSVSNEKEEEVIIPSQPYLSA